MMEARHYMYLRHHHYIRCNEIRKLIKFMSSKLECKLKCTFVITVFSALIPRMLLEYLQKLYSYMETRYHVKIQSYLLYYFIQLCTYCECVCTKNNYLSGKKTMREQESIRIASQDVQAQWKHKFMQVNLHYVTQIM